MRVGLLLIKWLSGFEYLHPFQKYSLPNFGVVRNHAKFCMYFAPKIFLGKGHKIFEPALSNSVYY